MKTLRHGTIRLAPDVCDRLDAEATLKGCTRAEIIRLAIDRYLDGVKLLSDSAIRHHRVTEFMQIALDAIIRENHPELRETLVLETDRRMERYHGSR